MVDVVFLSRESGFSSCERTSRVAREGQRNRRTSSEGFSMERRREFRKMKEEKEKRGREGETRERERRRKRWKRLEKGVDQSADSLGEGRD